VDRVTVPAGLSFLSLAAACTWSAVALLPWRPWAVREVLRVQPEGLPPEFDDLTVVIPARNEAGQIGTTLAALAEQGGVLTIILVDDHSEDGTAERALSVPGLNLEILHSEPLPDGWSGKLWALEQGIRRVRTRYTLLLDADIAVLPGALNSLLRQHERERASFLSVMARLRTESVWEKLLMPAFVYFFKMLYPFRLANSADPRFSAGAGGCIFVETAVLEAIGGVAPIRDALIDDCALAAKVKRAGYRTWIGLSHAVVSHRRYEGLAPIWEMVARTAFTQLRYSVLNLLICTVLLAMLFWVPVVGLGVEPAEPSAWVACSIMALTYMPTLRFYDRHGTWAFAMPIVAALYLAMTWSSALRYWRGERSRWKGRVYRSCESREANTVSTLPPGEDG
jgi:hopene-associated glycosyltransferase HpnB